MENYCEEDIGREYEASCEAEHNRVEKELEQLRTE